MKKALLMLCVLVSASLAFEVMLATDGTPVQWPMGAIPPHYLINQNTTDGLTLPAIVSAFNSGHDQWTNAPGQYFSWVYDGTTTIAVTNPNGPFNSDGHNVCGFYASSFSSGSTIAVNITWYNPNNGDIGECDQVFNTYNYTWNTTGAGGAMDIWNIDSHESGHTLLLKDLYLPSAMEHTMYGYANAGETKKRDIDWDDIAGIQYLYLDDTGVNLTSFTATAEKEGNLVRWNATETGEHVGYNLYRRSFAGTTSGAPDKSGYEKVNPALITGSGEYTFLDSFARKSNVQYLLADVDSAGREEYHGPITCEGRLSVGLSLRVSPNPCRGTATLAYSVPANLSTGSLSLSIYDVSGRMVASIPVDVSTGEHSASWNTSNVASGVYSARLSSGSQNFVTRLVVAR